MENDNKGVECPVYDIAFNPEVIVRSSNPKFKDMVVQSALDALGNKYQLKLNRESVKMPKMRFKGTPARCVIRKRVAEEEEGAFEHMPRRPDFPDVPGEKKEKEKKDVSKTKKVEEKKKPSDEPEYSILYRNDLDMGNFTNDRIGNSTPSSLCVTIKVPLHSKAKELDLDVYPDQLELHSQHYNLLLKLPYTVDSDNEGVECPVYDIAFNPEVIVRSSNPKFKDMVVQSALDALGNKYQLKLNRESVKMPKMRFKGTPARCVIRKRVAEEEEGAFEHMPRRPDFPDVPGEKKEKEKKDVSKTKKVEEKKKPSDEPEYSILYRNDLDMGNFTNDRIGNSTPSSLCVTIKVPLHSKAKELDLDVYPDQLELHSQHYNLLLKLPYTVDSDNGKAKFDKERKELKITLDTVQRDVPREVLEAVTDLPTSSLVQDITGVENGVENGVEEGAESRENGVESRENGAGEGTESPEGLENEVMEDILDGDAVKTEPVTNGLSEGTDSTPEPQSLSPDPIITEESTPDPIVTGESSLETSPEPKVSKPVEQVITEPSDIPENPELNTESPAASASQQKTDSEQKTESTETEPAQKSEKLQDLVDEIAREEKDTESSVPAFVKDLTPPEVPDFDTTLPFTPSADLEQIVLEDKTSTPETAEPVSSPRSRFNVSPVKDEEHAEMQLDDVFADNISNTNSLSSYTDATLEDTLTEMQLDDVFADNISNTNSLSSYTDATLEDTLSGALNVSIFSFFFFSLSLSISLSLSPSLFVGAASCNKLIPLQMLTVFILDLYKCWASPRKKSTKLGHETSYLDYSIPSFKVPGVF
eukprot:sb/3462148/